MICNPLLSIIIPVYNAKDTLRRCVDSILIQEFRDFELLLIDDGSKDESPIVCDEYAQKDTRVRVFHKLNGGVSSARNVGLDYAQGKWVTFIDADDKITYGYLNDIDSFADIIFKSYKKVIDDQVVVALSVNEIQCDSLPLFVNGYITKLLLRGPVFKFYKRNLIGNLRFLVDMKIGEDAWFVFNYMSRCKTLYFSKIGMYIVNMDERPDDVKYAISVDYAVQSLSYLKGAYEQLVQVHGIQKRQFLEYIGYFKRLSKSDWITDKRKWYSNQQIKSLYDYVWPDLRIEQKLRLMVAKLFKK